jgi:hypothetical protein
MGSRNQFNLSNSLTFNLGIFLSVTAGISASFFLTGRFTFIVFTEIKVVGGADIKVEGNGFSISGAYAGITGFAAKATATKAKSLTQKPMPSPSAGCPVEWRRA